LTVDLIGLTDAGAIYAPQPGDLFQIFEVFGELTGQFGSYELPTLYPSLIWNTSQLYSDGILHVQGMLIETDSLPDSIYPTSRKDRSQTPIGSTSVSSSMRSVPEPSSGMLLGMIIFGRLSLHRPRRIATMGVPQSA
jgi:hypothetical protein